MAVHASISITISIVFGIIFCTLQYSSVLNGIDSAIRVARGEMESADLQRQVFFRRHKYIEYSIDNPHAYFAINTSGKGEADVLTYLRDSISCSVVQIADNDIVSPNPLQVSIIAIATYVGIAIGVFAIMRYCIVVSSSLLGRADRYITWSRMPVARKYNMFQATWRIVILAQIVLVPLCSFTVWRLVTGGRMLIEPFSSSQLTPVVLDGVLFLLLWGASTLSVALVTLVVVSVRKMPIHVRSGLRQCSICLYEMGRLDLCPECGRRPSESKERLRYLLVRWVCINIIAAVSMGMIVWSIALVRLNDPASGLLNGLLAANDLVLLRPVGNGQVQLNMSKTIEIETDEWRAVLLFEPLSKRAAVAPGTQRLYNQHAWAILRQSSSSDPSDKSAWITELHHASASESAFSIQTDFSAISVDEIDKLGGVIPTNHWFYISPFIVMRDWTLLVDTPYELRCDGVIRSIRHSENGTWVPSLVSRVRNQLRGEK